jgi:ABC transporter DrrB family efflux protein
MTIAAPPLPRTAGERLRWAIVDAWTVAGRDLAHWVHQPGAVIVGLLFPIMMLLMFGYLLGGGMSIPGGGDYREFLLPGMFAMTMAFGLEATMTAVTTDAARGVTDRFRSMPMASSAVVAGRSIADMLHSGLGLAVMLASGLVVGWRWHNGVASALLALVLLMLLRFAMLWIGIFLGLIVRGPQAVVAVQILVWPMLFFSNVFTAPETMPGWLGVIAQWNPLSATVSATRELFGNPGWGGDAWIAQNALLMAVAWPVALVAVFAPLAVRRYQRLSR